ncbi:related to MGMT family protein [Cephalotrichum gorgonifer]|uniref:Related to MGMT family protein n=1 Tax=Cephalotrichum gorgonifer TaxID=2041049 RepID=A0AAE8N1B6_9PEZI|nr:related to MGMT family protein [Cephalotrichum gorgonifer]
MPRSDEAEAFYHAVYSAIQEIPRGKVTTYGHIAALIGTPDRPRQVGICLKHLPNDPDAEFNGETVPWQRVINSKGGISPRSNHPAGAQTQANALREEGIPVEANEMGELRVDLAKYGWFPTQLPSEAGDGEEEGENGGEGRE